MKLPCLVERIEELSPSRLILVTFILQWVQYSTIMGQSTFSSRGDEKRLLKIEVLVVSSSDEARRTS